MGGSNVPQTRTPDAHFMTEARYRGTKVAVVSPDYAEATKFADLWLNPKQGTDAALAMAMGRESSARSEEHTSELQSLMRISYAVFCLKKKKKIDTYLHK